MSEQPIRRLHRIRGEQELIVQDLKSIALSDGMDLHELKAVTDLQLRLLALATEALQLIVQGVANDTTRTRNDDNSHE